jgi:hypothetical protein
MNMKTSLSPSEMRTAPMFPVEMSTACPRSERRIAVHLPLKVRCRDKRGVTVEEDTSSENLCRSGAAFVAHFDVEIGSDLEIHIPFSHHTSRRSEADFETQGRVVHVWSSPSQSEKIVGVKFTGRRFQRVFRSESAVS